MPRAKRGFTLIEILVATVVAVLIMGAISSVFYYLLVIPPQQTDQLNAENQLRLSLDWIQRDGVQAHSFSLPDEYLCSASPDDYYGYFASYANASCADSGCPEILVAYRYDDDDDNNHKLIREESVDCSPDPPKTTTIAFHIDNYDHVIFAPLEGDDNTLTVNMTVTLNADSQNKVRKEISITDTRYIEMRAEK